MNPYHTLAAEKKELEDILAEIPAANVIERASFEARLKAVCQSLEGLETPALVKKGQSVRKSNHRKSLTGC
jgi:hypothetical protein